MSDSEKAHVDVEWMWINRVPAALSSLVAAWLPSSLCDVWDASPSAPMRQRLLALERELSPLDINFLNTLKLALCRLPDSCDLDRLDRGKINQIFEAMRLEPDGGLQSMWAQVLARELEDPGSFSRASIRELRDKEPEG